jgi:hypothetical protein
MADQQFPHEQRRKKKIHQHFTTAGSYSLIRGVSTSAWFNNPVKTKAKVLNSI